MKNPKQNKSEPLIAAGDHLVAIDRFIQATRDSGYKGTSSAIAELVDNALQAGATKILVAVEPDDGTDWLRVEVADNGCGMPPATLREALRFGGSSRFNDRRGLGRYGMGLPNSSFSQARCVNVASWTSPSEVWACSLDLEDIAAGKVATVPNPERACMPAAADSKGFRTGTVVRWQRCDRLDFRRPSTIATKLRTVLGRVFRFFIWDGVDIRVNGERVVAFDPLCVHTESTVTGATLYAEPLEYDIDISLPDGKGNARGKVVVRFSELPVHKWHALTNEEKQRLGILKGAGVSIVRAKREIDFGWFMLGEKRKENYDDWWRCELQFDPGLDEVFGITHTKQQIHPTHDLAQVLSPDLEGTAKTLNRRVRQAHERLQSAVRVAESQKTAGARESLLPPLAKRLSLKDRRDYKTLERRHPEVKQAKNNANGGLQYSMVVANANGARLFRTYRDAGHLVMALNADHPFYKKVYAPLCDDGDPRRKAIRQHLELILLAAARTEAAVGKVSKPFLTYWSDVLATFLQ